MRKYWTNLLCATLFGLSPALLAAQKAESRDAAPPVLEKITERMYRVGGVLIDTTARTVTCPGVINMDQGAIEYLAVAPNGKLHESLLRLDIRPLHLQLGLLMLGLDPKNVLKYQGDRTTPRGAPVSITISWHTRTGEVMRVAADALVMQMPGEKSMPAHNWVFTGSRILRAGFEADLAKSLVAVWHDPAAILDNPLPGGGNNAYFVNAKRAPRRGTPIECVFTAADATAPGGGTGASRP